MTLCVKQPLVDRWSSSFSLSRGAYSSVSWTQTLGVVLGVPLLSGWLSEPFMWRKGLLEGFSFVFVTINVRKGTDQTLLLWWVEVVPCVEQSWLRWFFCFLYRVFGPTKTVNVCVSVHVQTYTHVHTYTGIHTHILYDRYGVIAVADLSRTLKESRSLPQSFG